MFCSCWFPYFNLVISLIIFVRVAANCSLLACTLLDQCRWFSTKGFHDVWDTYARTFVVCFRQWFRSRLFSWLRFFHFLGKATSTVSWTMSITVNSIAQQCKESSHTSSHALLSSAIACITSWGMVFLWPFGCSFCSGCPPS